MTTQGEMEVPMFLAPNGPRGMYSHFWMSLRQRVSSRTGGAGVPGRPVVHEDHAEDVLPGLLGGDGVPQGGAGAAHEEGHLQLEVHEAAGTELGRLRLHGPSLAVWPADWSPGDDHRGGPAVVAHGQVLPVGHQGVLLAAEHGAHVLGVIEGGVEVGVVSDGGGQVHGGAALGHHGRLLEGAVPDGGAVPGGEGRWDKLVRHAGMVQVGQDGGLSPNTEYCSPIN